MIWRVLARSAGPSTLTVLYFHRVLSVADPMLPDEPTAPLFARMLKWLRSQYQALPLAEALARLDAGTLPRAAAAITFDDGYRDNLEVAAPLLREAGLPATFFVATGFLDGGVMWNDRIIEAVRRSPSSTLELLGLSVPFLRTGSMAERSRAAELVIRHLKYLPFDARAEAVQQVERACLARAPTDLMMTPNQVRALRGLGFEIGAHTRCHPILRQLDDDVALAEIAGSRDDLHTILGETVQLFAYPNGRQGIDFDERHANMVRDTGFAAAFTTDAGAVTGTSQRWCLPRFTPWRRTPLGFRLQLLRNQLRRSAPTQQRSAISTK